MVKSRNASSTIFGFDFQVYAGIYLMLSNMASMTSLKIEGEDEDIEIALKDGTTIYAQAKSFTKPFEVGSSDKRKKLRAALISLNGVKGPSNSLVYITNLSERSPFSGDSPDFHLKNYIFRYDEIPSNYQKIIDEIISKDELNLDTANIRIAALAFYGDDKTTRRESVENKLKEMLMQSRTNLISASSEILDRWHASFYANGSTRKGRITKDDVVYDLVLFSVNTFNDDVQRLADELNSNEADIYEALQMYDSIIDYESNKYLKYNIIIQMHEQYVASSGKIKVAEFITSQAEEIYKTIFHDEEIQSNDEDSLKACAQIIAYKILFKRREIQHIKRGVESYGN